MSCLIPIKCRTINESLCVELRCNGKKIQFKMIPDNAWILCDTLCYQKLVQNSKDNPTTFTHIECLPTHVCNLCIWLLPRDNGTLLVQLRTPNHHIRTEGYRYSDQYYIMEPSQTIDICMNTTGFYSLLKLEIWLK